MISSGRAVDRTAILAAAQSSGRGRFRRTWVSHHGNLYVSFIFSAPERDARLSYCVAVAVAETIASFGMRPTIKWPNDILVDGNKISGTLIEYSGDFVVVGIGINVNSNPTVDRYRTTKMDLDKWRRADFRAVRARWLEMAACLNRPVKYQGEPAILVGINENGALVLRRDTRYLLVWGDEITV